MRRRRLLALSAGVIGLSGCGGNKGSLKNGTTGMMSTSRDASRGAFTETERARPAATTPHVGGSLNGRARRLGDDLELLEESNTTWLHAFLDVRKKHERNANPRDDPDVKALRHASRDKGVKLIIALKWNFTGNFGNVEPTNVPQSGSARRQTLFEYATKLLRAIERPVDIIVLGNEPVWEAPDKDVKGSDPPLISFTRELKDHLVTNYDAGDPQYLVGSFNRLYGEHVRKEYGQFYQQLFEMARNDDEIDGIDLHVHYDGFRQAEEMFTVARNKVPEGTITATEFSPVWRYERNKDVPIAAFKNGGRFVDQYGIPPETTVTEYYRAATENPRSRSEMGDFMEAMPWYNANFVEDLYDLLNEYDAKVGAFGFLQDTGFRHAEITSDWIPFQINYLFQRGVIDTEDGAHPHYLDDYRKRT